MRAFKVNRSGFTGRSQNLQTSSSKTQDSRHKMVDFVFILIINYFFHLFIYLFAILGSPTPPLRNIWIRHWLNLLHNRVHVVLTFISPIHVNDTPKGFMKWSIGTWEEIGVLADRNISIIKSRCVESKASGRNTNHFLSVLPICCQS
jgi:hypothetical protein